MNEILNDLMSIANSLGVSKSGYEIHMLAGFIISCIMFKSKWQNIILIIFLAGILKEVLDIYVGKQWDIGDVAMTVAGYLPFWILKTLIKNLRS